MRAMLRNHRGLVLLNVALLVTVVLVGFGRPATAQNSGKPAEPTPNRGRGDYTMVSGKTGSGGTDAIYIVDAANQELVALRWEPGRQTLSGIGYRDIAADAKVLPGR